MGKTEQAPIEMRKGAVAVVDALGFKAARERHTLEQIVTSLQRVRDKVSNQAGMHRLFGGASTTIAAFSDSLILANLTQADDWVARRQRQVSLSDTVYNLASCAAAVMVSAAQTEAPLCYRGCIVAGDLFASGTTFVGQAMDDAVELAEAANAAIAWLAPSSRQVVERDPKSFAIAYVNWEVPLRSGGTVGALAVNPFLHEVIEHIENDLNPEALLAIEALLVEPMRHSNRVDVMQKLKHTAAFLQVAKQQTLDGFQQVQDKYFDDQAEGRRAYENGEA